MGTDAMIVFLITLAGKKICYCKLLVYKLFLQRTYSDTQVSLRFKSVVFMDIVSRSSNTKSQETWSIRHHVSQR